ncbi:type II toxin-antitoxin system RelE/ParE family toxin [Roseibium sp. AS2]|uniref:type II toxin-antitoxin system RelE/ParE family toxin n=1 Tax=Roseibium sp. AS2 TaxID=3135781 RepID=UPI003173147B
MKQLVFSPAALSSLEDILFETIAAFGDAQAERYSRQLAARLDALASGSPPHAISCSRLLQGNRDAKGLKYYREGRHYLILRESSDTLELVEVFHERMQIEARLQELEI